MPIANPIVQAGGGVAPPPPPPAAATTGAPIASDDGPGFADALVGRGGFFDPSNTAAQVGVIVAASLLLITLLHIGGFRFAVDAGVTNR